MIIIALQVGLIKYDNELYGYGIVRSQEFKKLMQGAEKQFDRVPGYQTLDAVIKSNFNHKGNSSFISIASESE